MRWAKPLEELCFDLTGGQQSGVVIRDIVEDHREAVPGCLFVARSGARVDGRSFAVDAVRSGAVAILCDHRGLPDDPGVPILRCENPDLMALDLADRLFGPPRLPVVAVTGTNGKTTVATFLHQLLEEPTGLISSIEVTDGSERRPARLTTPRGLELRRIIAAMSARGCQRVVMEASSHGLALGRLRGLNIEVAVFTNLSGDHLDFHGSMPAYCASKRSLFAGLSRRHVGIINLDDPAGAVMSAATAGRLVSCSMRNPVADYRSEITARGPDGMSFRLYHGGVTSAVTLPLPGDHNVMNAVQAAVAAACCGQPLARSLERTAGLTTPRGRLERVSVQKPGPRVFVDFAHTDAALHAAIGSLRSVVPAGGQLVVVFGCGGDHDKTKRPRMAAVAARGADRVVITSDNPRTESPQRIVDDICVGLPSGTNAVIEIDRTRAIAQAIHESGPEDVVLIAGKGHETYQIIGDQTYPFDDREVARTMLERWERIP